MLQFPEFFAFSMLSFLLQDTEKVFNDQGAPTLMPILHHISLCFFFPFIVLTLRLCLGHFPTDFSLLLTKPDMW